MSGWLLFLHVVMAGVFVIAIALLAGAWLVRRMRLSGGGLRHGVFVALLAAAGGTILSMLLVMRSTSTTGEQEQLLVVHGYAGLALVICCALHATMTMQERRRAS